MVLSSRHPAPPERRHTAVQRADYQGDRAALERLHEDLAPAAASPGPAQRLHRRISHGHCEFGVHVVSPPQLLYPALQ
jgi:hypothetical protein